MGESYIYMEQAGATSNPKNPSYLILSSSILPCLRGDVALSPSPELLGVGVLDRGFILGWLTPVVPGPNEGLSDLLRRSPTSHMDFHLRGVLSRSWPDDSLLWPSTRQQLIRQYKHSPTFTQE